MVMRPSVGIKLTEDERSELERLARGRKVWRALSDRAHIVLLAAEGLTNVQIGKALGVTDQTTRKWRNRFAAQRLDGLDDEPRCGSGGIAWDGAGRVDPVDASPPGCSRTSTRPDLNSPFM